MICRNHDTIFRYHLVIARTFVITIYFLVITRYITSLWDYNLVINYERLCSSNSILLSVTILSLFSDLRRRIIGSEFHPIELQDLFNTAFFFLFTTSSTHFYKDKKVWGGGVNFTFSMITYPNHGKLGHRHADACGSLGTFTSLHYDTLGIYWKDINAVWQI